MGKHHGMHGTPTYRSWQNMKTRCNNSNRSFTHIYLQLDYDPKWGSFLGFLEDMGERPEGTTLDREDNDLGYNLENCRWADSNVQCANRTKFQSNTSGFTGVREHGSKWRAQIDWRGQVIHIGNYSSPYVAAIERDRYIKDNNLPHTLNFPEEIK